MARLNGWQAGHAEQYRARSSRARRAARLRALKRGDADPIFQPFSKRITPDFAEAVHPETRPTSDGGGGRNNATRRQLGDDIADRFTDMTQEQCALFLQF